MKEIAYCMTEHPSLWELEGPRTRAFHKLLLQLIALRSIKKVTMLQLQELSRLIDRLLCGRSQFSLGHLWCSRLQCLQDASQSCSCYRYTRAGTQKVRCSSDSKPRHVLFSCSWCSAAVPRKMHSFGSFTLFYFSQPRNEWFLAVVLFLHANFFVFRLLL